MSCPFHILVYLALLFLSKLIEWNKRNHYAELCFGKRKRVTKLHSDHNLWNRALSKVSQEAARLAPEFHAVLLYLLFSCLLVIYWQLGSSLCVIRTGILQLRAGGNSEVMYMCYLFIVAAMIPGGYNEYIISFQGIV